MLRVVARSVVAGFPKLLFRESHTGRKRYCDVDLQGGGGPGGAPSVHFVALIDQRSTPRAAHRAQPTIGVFLSVNTPNHSLYDESHSDIAAPAFVDRSAGLTRGKRV